MAARVVDTAELREPLGNQENETTETTIGHNVPALLKLDQPFPVTCTTTTTADYQATTMDYQETTNNIQNSPPSSPTSSDEREILEETTHARPSVINLGSGGTIANVTPTLLTPTPDATTPIDNILNGERPERMREWLVRMINSGRFAGLEWIDQEQMIFRVPWIHAKKRDYNQERDAALFKEWAIHSGKYGDGSDVTTWKINFRCALNGLKDVIERKDLEGPDCRVYQMLPSTSIGRRRKRRRPIIHYSDMMNLQSPVDRNMKPRMDIPLGIATPTLHTPTTPTPMTPTPIQLVPIVTAGTPLHFPIPLIQTTATTPQGITFPSALSPTFHHKYRPIIPTAIKPSVTTPMTSPMEQRSPVAYVQLPESMIRNRIRSVGAASDGGSVTPTSEQTPESIRTMFSSHFVSSPKQVDKVSLTMFPPLRTGRVHWPPAEFVDVSNALTVRIMYGSITVHMDTLDCTNGCRIFYGPLHCRDVLPADEEEKLFGPLAAHQISVSPRHPSALAPEIFKTMKRGLVLDVQDMDMYATALCRAVVYHGTSPMKHTGTLEKEERIKVFSYAQFLSSLKYQVDGNRVPPKPFVIFSFGQPWSGDRPLSQNLVTLVVTHCKALNDMRLRNVPIHDDLLFEAQENHDIRIISPTQRDLEAEEFLNPSSNPSTPH